MKYFTIPELCASATARALGIDNSADKVIEQNLRTLVDTVLDPLREAWGNPITVTSGYRCPELNRAVGGVRNSHHLRGMAADISTGDVIDNRRLFQLVRDLGLPFTQLIDEHNFAWVHIAFDPADIRMEVKRI